MYVSFGGGILQVYIFTAERYAPHICGEGVGVSILALLTPLERVWRRGCYASRCGDKAGGPWCYVGGHVVDNVCFHRHQWLGCRGCSASGCGHKAGGAWCYVTRIRMRACG